MAHHASIPDWHVLDFFCDDALSSALTVLVRGFRFHIIADKDELPISSQSGNRYDELVQRLQQANNGDIKSEASSASHTDTDSGVDVKDEEQSSKKNYVDPEGALQRFMLAPLSDELNKLSKNEEQESLQEWYNGPTYFYSLKLASDDDEIEAVQLEATSDLTERMEKLKPEMALPKYLTEKMDVPFHNASDLTVISTSDQPPGTPYHPCRVRKNGSKQAFFLKIVDNNQPNPIKRELDILYRAMELNLSKEINIPALTGLVTFDDAENTKAGQKRIMGFLQTDILGAQPLTRMLDSSIPQDKRERWAAEADRAKEVLHAHDIIWGDAKADNFVVDEDDKLWIIDFGGSYTEGWVDPEKKETLEGDDMGTERIVNALEDPVANTYNPDEEGEEGEGCGEGGEVLSAEEKGTVTFSPDRERKRKREADHVDVESGASGGKKARKQG